MASCRIRSVKPAGDRQVLSLACANAVSTNDVKVLMAPSPDGSLKRYFDDEDDGRKPLSALRPVRAPVGQTTGGAGAWTTVGLLFLFMLINFADRAVLGLAAVPIMHELGLSHTEFGLIGASFFTFFSAGAVIVGFLVNRVATKWVLAVLALTWSLCQLPLLLPLSAAALIANRVALGLSEGPAYPVALHAAYKWFPPEQRAMPTSPHRYGRPSRQRNRRAGARLCDRGMVLASGVWASRCSRARLVHCMACGFP